MKIMGKLKSIFSLSLLSLLVVATSVFTLPSVGVFAATGDPPAIEISSPTENNLLNDKTVVISGTYTDENVNQGTDLLFTASDNPSGKGLVDITSQGTWEVSKSLPNGTWSFTTTFSEEGTHVVTIAIKEGTAPTLNKETSITFTIDTKRPYITNAGIVHSDNTVLNGEDLTNVPQDARIKFTVVDDNKMDQLFNKITNSNYSPVKLNLGTGMNLETALSGITKIVYMGKQYGKYVYEITFTPSKQLLINKNYLTYLDPGLLDDSNNPVYVKYLKFTTKTNTDWDDLDEQSHSSSNPHGHYKLNTNMCASCHSTHVNSPLDNLAAKNDSNPPLEGGSYLISLKDKTKDYSENYCMACHDGTMNAPAIDGANQHYSHDNPVEYTSTGTNNLKQANSCTSCHNPHSEWSEGNPNLLQDHFVYTHKSGKKVDSYETACSSCHEDNMAYDYATNSKESIFNTNAFKNGKYEPLQYKKSITASGDIENYSLCLRCHDGKKASNINQYYQQTASSVPANKHFIAAQDGSNLNGLMPCAECHDTHGSDNSYLLKKNLGHENPQPDFLITGKIESWTADNERTFCTKCHNGSTKIYGITGDFDATIPGHTDADKNKTCSSCHSSSGNIVEAAHSPKVN